MFNSHACSSDRGLRCPAPRLRGRHTLLCRQFRRLHGSLALLAGNVHESTWGCRCDFARLAALHWFVLAAFTGSYWPHCLQATILESIHRNFERDATEPSGQLPQDVGSGADLDVGSGEVRRCGAGLRSAGSSRRSGAAVAGCGLATLVVVALCFPATYAVVNTSPTPLFVQRWRTAAATAAPTSSTACCSRATAWSGRALERCGTAPRAGSAWRPASGWVGD